MVSIYHFWNLHPNLGEESEPIFDHQLEWLLHQPHAEIAGLIKPLFSEGGIFQTGLKLRSCIMRTTQLYENCPWFQDPGNLKHAGIQWISCFMLCSYLGGGLKHFLFSLLPGEMVQFDEHIFQMGWFNHQLVMSDMVLP